MKIPILFKWSHRRFQLCSIPMNLVYCPHFDHIVQSLDATHITSFWCLFSTPNLTIYYHSNNIECWLIKKFDDLTWQLHEMKQIFRIRKTKKLMKVKSELKKELGTWPNYVVPHMFLAVVEVGQLDDWRYNTTNKWLLPRQTTTHVPKCNTNEREFYPNVLNTLPVFYMIRTFYHKFLLSCSCFYFDCGNPSLPRALPGSRSLGQVPSPKFCIARTSL